MRFQAALSQGGTSHLSQHGSGIHRITHRYRSLLGQIGIYCGHPIWLKDGHRRSHHGIIVHLSHLAFPSSEHFPSLFGGDVDPTVGPPVPHCLIIGKGLHCKAPQNLSLDWPGIDYLTWFRLSGRLCLSILLRLRIIWLNRSLWLWLGLVRLLFRKGCAAVRQGNARVCCNRLLSRLAPADGANQIIARNSNCGDAQEQDYVEALSQHKVAQFFQSVPFHGNHLRSLLWTGTGGIIPAGCDFFRPYRKDMQKRETWIDEFPRDVVYFIHETCQSEERTMYRTITLPNGARLLTEYIPGARSAALGFFVGAGSRHERATENGAAHFIEHLSFKGTDQRSAADLAREIDAIGGQVNAYTTKESTCYYARCLDRHLDRASDLLCDMLFHSRFAQEDVELERGVILEEIGMYEDTPEDLCADRLSMAVYKGRPLGRPILGRASTLNEMTGESLRQWQTEHYCPSSIVVALAGRFEERHITALRERLAALPASTPNRVRDAVYHPAVTVRRKAIEQNHLILAYPGLSYRDDKRYALLLLNSILGGGCSSRLFQELREKRGLCYTVYSYVADHADTGLLGIYTATGGEQEAQALEAVRNIVSDLAEHGPTQEELDRAREQAQAGLLMGLESVQSRMSHLGASGLLYGRVREVDELLECYEKVTREELLQLAQYLFLPQGTSLSAVGRVRTAEEYASWLSH